MSDHDTAAHMIVDSPEPTFLFADLSGFTALTEAHGDEQAADLVAEFCAVVRELLAAHDAQQVKTIGDALMIRGATASGAVLLGTRIVREVGAQHGFPMIRVGMHTGVAVERDGDWFGAAVNLAARVSGVASGGEVLVTETTRSAAGEVHGVAFHERGRQALRNIAEPVLLFAAVTQGVRDSGGLPIDPVCRMAVSPERAAGGSATMAWSFTSARSNAPGPSPASRGATPPAGLRMLERSCRRSYE